MNQALSANGRCTHSAGVAMLSLLVLLGGGTLGCSTQEEGAPSSADVIELRDGRVRLEVSDVGKLSVLQRLADQGGFDLELHEISPRPVTLRLEKATLAEAVAAIVGESRFEIEYAFDPETGGHAVSLLRVGFVRPLESAGFVAAAKDSTASAMDALREADRPADTESTARRETSSRDSIDAAREELAPLREALDRSEGEERRALAAEYARAEDALQGALREALRDPDPVVRAEALDEIKASEGDARERIASLAQTDPDPNVRLAAIELLAEDGTFQAVTELVTMLDDPEPRVLLATLDALDFSGDESLAPTIAPLARHSDARVREKAREMLDFWE